MNFESFYKSEEERRGVEDERRKEEMRRVEEEDKRRKEEQSRVEEEDNRRLEWESDFKCRVKELEDKYVSTGDEEFYFSLLLRYAIEIDEKYYLVCGACKASTESGFHQFFDHHQQHDIVFLSENEKRHLVLKSICNTDFENFVINQKGSGIKRSVVSIPVHTSKKRKTCPTIESDLDGAHEALYVDVSDEQSTKVIVPDCLLEELQRVLAKHVSSKIQFGIDLIFTKDDGELKDAFISNMAYKYSENFIQDGVDELNQKIQSYSELSSGWRVHYIKSISMTILKTSDIIHLSGSSYIQSPPCIESAKATINVKNDNNFCFIYSILSILKYDLISKHKTSLVSSYDPFLKDLVYDETMFPMTLANISKFERKNPTLEINVFGYNDVDVFNYDKSEIVKNPFIDIIYRSKKETDQKVNLLLITEGENFHYLGIRNLDRLLNIRMGNIRVQSHWCHICLHGFRNEKAYQKHIALCRKNKEMTTQFTMPKEKFLVFRDWSKTIQSEFVIYADFEAILAPDNKYFQRHEPVAAGMMLLKSGLILYYQEYIGPECIINFLKKVEEWGENIVFPWYEKHKNIPMTDLTRQELILFKRQSKCYICNKSCSKLVKDHDHMTGKYLGGACNKCNLARQMRPALPIVFHNLRGYDMHHILKYGLSDFKDWTMRVIPQTQEKFLSLIIDINKHSYRFIDSLQFLSSSLAKLVDNLSALPITEMGFESSSHLMKGKGLFPYDMVSSMQVLTEHRTSLPPKWKDDISEEEYNNAVLVWEEFECKSLLDYMEIYLKLDVHLLADVFEAFRKTGWDDDGLEALTFFSIPGMSWASSLKSMKYPVELVQDPELYKFFEGGIRGGMTFINRHFVKSDDNTQLLYIDINNLYGWAMSQKLPYGNFRWILEEEELEQVLEKCRSDYNFEDSDIGYNLEVDIHIPPEIHDKLNDLPVAPESDYPPESKVKKLLLTHTDKSNYVIHCRLLQIFLKLKVEITKVHRAVEYSQGPIFADYIKRNTIKRQSGKNEFERNYYKLKNNSLYGKCVENLKNRMNLRLCNNSKKMITYASSPFFRKSMKIDKDLIALHLAKETIELNKPSYIGQVILDISKVRMYTLQYIELEKYRTPQCEINIVAGDTDSFFLECKGIDLETQLFPSLINDNLLDTSKFKNSHPLYSTRLQDVLGKFKDESKGEGWKEWIFLRPKSYSLLSKDNKEVNKTKGVQLKDSEIRHQSYKEAYDNNTIFSIPQTRILSKKHQLFTIQSMKRALHCLDDKRFWSDKNISYAYGHYKTFV